MLSFYVLPVVERRAGVRLRCFSSCQTLLLWRHARTTASAILLSVQTIPDQGLSDAATRTAQTAPGRRNVEDRSSDVRRV